MSESELAFPGFEYVDCRTPAFPDPPGNEVEVEHIVAEDEEPDPEPHPEIPGNEVEVEHIVPDDEGEYPCVDLTFVEDRADVTVEDDDGYISYEQHKENISAGAYDEEIAAAFDSEMSPAEAVRLYGKRALRIWAGIALRRAGRTTELNLPTDDSYVNFWSNQGRPFARHGTVHTVNLVESSMPRKHNSWTVSDELAKAINANIAAQGGVK